MSASYEIVVVGGGIHGAGVLQAAAAAGYRALLVEQRAIASGTSSRSSKLVHGGLRYLESGKFALVRESLRERTILTRLAPELVKLVPFHIPVYRDTMRTARTIRAGLAAYAVLGGLARSALFSSRPASEWPDLDGLARSGLKAVFRYYDGQTDDAALTRAVIASAVELGASVRVQTTLRGARRDDNGYELECESNGATARVRALVLVNAAGPWIESVRECIDPLPPGFGVDLVAGTHLELEGQLERGMYYVEAPSDRRAVFAMPWKGRTLLGTTETPYVGDPARVAPLASEVEYLLATYAHYFPGRSTRVLDSWAGLRVLPRGSGRAFDRPRETTFVVDDESTPRYLAIYGGKLTGYRATAEKALARCTRTLGRRHALASTSDLPLHLVLDS